MKKKIILASLILLSMCGCSKTIPVLKDGSEAVVSFKDGSLISINELYDELKDAYGTAIIIDMIDKKILEEKYSDKLDDAKETAAASIKSLQTYYVDENGNYDENSLLSAIQSTYGYNSIEEFEEALRINYLRNLAVEDYAKSQIKDSEVNKYYKNEVFGDRKVSHIEIIPEVTKDMKEDEIKKKEAEALNLAKEVIAKLKKGEKFEDLAKQYSDDDSTKEVGGILGFINKGYYGSEAFDKEMYALAVGKFSTTPVKTESGYEIIFVHEEKDKKSLDDMKEDIIETLANELLNDDATVQVKAVDELRKEFGVEIIDSEIETNYERYMDRLYDAAKKNNVSK